MSEWNGNPGEEEQMEDWREVTDWNPVSEDWRAGTPNQRLENRLAQQLSRLEVQLAQQLARIEAKLDAVYELLSAPRRSGYRLEELEAEFGVEQPAPEQPREFF